MNYLVYLWADEIFIVYHFYYYYFFYIISFLTHDEIKVKDGDTACGEAISSPSVGAPIISGPTGTPSVVLLQCGLSPFTLNPF